MAFQSVPDCAAAAISFTQAGKQMINRLTFAKAGGYDQTDIDNLAAAVDTVVGTTWLPLVNGSCHYDGVEVKGLADIVDLLAVNADSAGFGTASGNALPNNVTWAVRFTTGATGRSARGRMYVIGLPDAQVGATTSLVDVTFAGQWVSAILALGDAAALDGWLACVVSRFTGGAERTTGTYRIITTVSFFNRLSDSQRGRLPK